MSHTTIIIILGAIMPSCDQRGHRL